MADLVEDADDVGVAHGTILSRENEERCVRYLEHRVRVRGSEFTSQEKASVILLDFLPGDGKSGDGVRGRREGSRDGTDSPTPLKRGDGGTNLGGGGGGGGGRRFAARARLVAAWRSCAEGVKGLRAGGCALGRPGPRLNGTTAEALLNGTTAEALFGVGDGAGAEAGFWEGRRGAGAGGRAAGAGAGGGFARAFSRKVVQARRRLDSITFCND